MKVTSAPLNRSENGTETLRLSDAGRLTQFGAYLETLPAGGQSSDRHWHSSEDEMLLVVEGAATVVDDDGQHKLRVGDAACWRHGDPNGHHVQNRGDAPLRYVIIGSRVVEDVCTYPDLGRKLVNGMTDWRVVNADGTIRRQGALPAELLNLRSDWGSPFDPATRFPRILPNAARPWTDEPDTAHPILGTGPGPYRSQLISDPGGLTQFGAFFEELPPGSRSGHRHWHETEDEMVYVLAGEVVLVEATETILRAGDAACWPAGHPVGHRLDNRSATPARYLVIGTRNARDTIHYTDHDLITHKDGPARRYLRRDGTPHPDRRTP